MKKKNCQWTGCRLFSILSTLSEHQHERRNNLQCGNAPRLAIFPRQETRKVLHLVNSSSIFLNFSSLKEKNNNKKPFSLMFMGLKPRDLSQRF